MLLRKRHRNNTRNPKLSVPYTHDTHYEWLMYVQTKYLVKAKIKNVNINDYFDWD